MDKIQRVPAKAAAPPRRYRGIDAGERVFERRKQFIEAGLECFGTRGFHSVTVRELCARAQLTERYFYESFKDREALFGAVYDSLIAQLRAEFVGVAAPKAPVLADMARAGIGAFFGRLHKDPRIGRILMVEVLTVSSEMERRAQSATFGFGDLLKQMTLATLPGGIRQTQSMDLIATGLIGASVHMAMRWIADGYHPPIKIVIETAMTFFEATIRLIGATPPVDKKS